jgi:hypothetical protein
MRRQALQQRKRMDLVWTAVGFVLIQLSLSIGLETCWPAIRDPDFADLELIVQDRHKEAPHRLMVFALGSSRTLMALRAERLNDPSDPNAPLVINCAVSGGGPMMSQIALRRLLHLGLRPQRVFLEIMPEALSIRDGASLEERQRLGGRYTAAEAIRLWGYYAQPSRLFVPWINARLLPCNRHQAEMRMALRIDLPPVLPRYVSNRDDYGWVTPGRNYSPQEVEGLTGEALQEYATALTQPALAPRALQACRDGIKLCRDKQIQVVLVVPPEGSRFRSFAPEVAQIQMDAVRGLADEFGLPLIDSRTWVDDKGFYDGHHAIGKGADQYTERFRSLTFIPSPPTPLPSGERGGQEDHSLSRSLSRRSLTNIAPGQ